ncbi:LysR substrate-binding domain-containing protein [Psychromonas sp.]|uniref:LysR substrate-binding domain-containing protein n=1 Tax=Psychromonas sp. TaxID=1884585 RepID=UPI00356AC1C3
MKLQQLKYLIAIKNHGLNITSASKSVFSAQPGISKQISLLESELGVRIFERKGKHLQSITPIGMKIIKEAEELLRIEQKIKTISQDYLDPDRGCLNIFTTNTIAKYLMPHAVSRFVNKYPQVSFHLSPAFLNSAGSQINKGESDFSIVAQVVQKEKDLIILPAYKWTLSLMVPKDHPLNDGRIITLEDLCNFPIISYEEGATGRESQDAAFLKSGLTPNYFMTVMDIEVIKRYVELGLGIGIIATIATHHMDEKNMASIPLDHLFSPSDAWLCFSKNIFLRNYMYDFIEDFLPHLTKEVMEKVSLGLNEDEMNAICNDFKLETY